MPNRASGGRLLRVPPYRFDLAAEPFRISDGLFGSPPSPDDGRRIANLYTDGPILYSRNMVRAHDTRYPLVPAGSVEVGDFGAFRPGTWGRRGFVTKVPKLVVVTTGLIPPEEAVFSAYNAAASAAPPDATILVNYGIIGRLGTILRWAPPSVNCTNANTGDIEFLIDPETWIGGDVCNVVVSNGYPFNDEVSGNPPTTPYFVISSLVTAERDLFTRAMARVNRFQGTILYEPNPPPPDNPQPDDPPPIHEVLPPGSTFATVCGGFPWTLVPVGGNASPAANESAIRAAITSFFG